MTETARGFHWSEPLFDDKTLDAYARKSGLDATLSALLLRREVPPEEVEAFLHPTLRHLFPDPSSLKDMDVATELIAKAILEEKTVAVLADYDVDGATSAAQLIRYFRYFGRDLVLYVPDRLKEGYGPSPEAFESLKAQGVDLVITVDCGAAAEAALRRASEIDLDIIVVDHHLMGEDIPSCAALVNPNRPDCESEQGHLAAAGVVYVLTASLNRYFRNRLRYTASDLPDLMKNLDLCSLGTLCDMAPLVALNRAFVVQGLKILAHDECPGIVALSQVSGRSPPRKVTDLTFGIGPQLNAGGRIGDPWLATQLLASLSIEEAVPIAEQLFILNQARKDIEADIQNEARKQIHQLQRHNVDYPVYVVGGEGWHPGIIGIVAGRLKDEFHRPVAVVGWGEQFGDVGKGSARSVSGLNIGKAISAASEAGVLVTGGGHAMAGGFSIDPERMQDFRDFLSTYFANVEKELDEARVVQIDFDVLVSAMTPRFIDVVEQAGPYGAAATKPVVRVKNAQIVFSRVIGANHLKVTLDDGSGRISAIAWRAAETDLGSLLQKGHTVDLIGYPERDEWGSARGQNSVQIEIIDAMKKN